MHGVSDEGIPTEAIDADYAKPSMQSKYQSTRSLGTHVNRENHNDNESHKFGDDEDTYQDDDYQEVCSNFNDDGTGIYENDENYRYNDQMEYDEDYHSHDDETYDENGYYDDEPTKPVLFTSHEGEHQGDYGTYGVGLSKNVILYVLCASINSCNLGYDIGINTDAGRLLQESMGISDINLEIFLASLNLFAMFGALVSHNISDSFGRKGAFMVSSLVFILGIVIMSISQNFIALMFGRVFMGIGVGFGLAIDPIYISEISPTPYRGMLVTFSEFAANFGIVLGYIAGLSLDGLDQDTAWRCMFGIGIVPPALMIVLLWTVMPESPRWLVVQEREAEAAHVLRKIYGHDYDVITLVNSMKLSLIKSEEIDHSLGWDLILFPSPAYRRILLVSLGIATAQQVIGISAMQYFMVTIMAESGLKSRFGQALALICIGCIKLAVIALAGKLYDQQGRKKLLFYSLGGCSVSLLLLSFNFYGKYSIGFAIFALSIYMSSYSVGIGPLAWLIPSEILPTSIRAKGMSLATFLNRTMATLMYSTFLSVAHALSWSGFFLMMSCVSLIIALFMAIFLPETKGRSLEDMIVNFAEITGDRSILEVEMSHQGQAVGKHSDSYSSPDEPMEDDNINVHASGMMA